MTIAVYPGTFDPMTLGHEDIVRRAARIFDKVYVGVAHNPGKRPLLPLETRVALAKESCAQYPNVEVYAFEGLLKNFVLAREATVIVRGARAVSDFEYEFQMAGMNRQLMPEADTIFLTPSDQYQFVSGTFVREIASLSLNDAAKFVSPNVLAALAVALRGKN